ncbi:hypothetical protein PCAR4_810025 [Paraburkholderia caribensis]|nr:hypothetical protein PCAR4_810025 [Paraburkholderia caribensis]
MQVVSEKRLHAKLSNRHWICNLVSDWVWPRLGAIGHRSMQAGAPKEKPEREGSGFGCYGSRARRGRGTSVCATQS